MFYAAMFISPPDADADALDAERADAAFSILLMPL